MSLHVSYIGKDVENLRGCEDEGEVSPYLTVENIRHFKKFFSFLNPKDRDILYLIFLSRKKQKEVQDLIDRGQPSLCYDIKQVRKRLKFISYLHSVMDIFFDFVTDDSRGYTESERAVMTAMFYSTSYILSAGVLRISQVRISSIFDGCIRKSKERKEWEIYEILSSIRDNRNRVKRVYKRKGVLLDEAVNY